MKTLSKSLFLFIVSSLLLTACLDKEEVGEALSEEEAVEVIESALAESSEGLTSQVEESAKMSEEVVAQPEASCDKNFDSTIVKMHPQGNPVTYDYTFEYGWKLICNRMIPQQIELNYSSLGTYSSARLFSKDEGTFAGVITGLTQIDTHFVYNGTFTRTGYQESKVRNNNEFNSSLTITTTNLKYNRSTEVVDSGTLTFTLTGDVVDGRSFSFTGTVTFLGNKSATVLVNGNSYTIQL